MGNRKFKLKHQKNYERKKYRNFGLKVPIRHLKIKCSKEVPDLSVHIPIGHYINSPASNASALYSQLSISKRLPEGWTTSLLVSESHSPLFSLRRHIENCSVDIHITVTPNCDWSMSIGTSSFDTNNCQLLKAFIKLDTIDTVVELLSTIDNSMFCIGNPDMKFNYIIKRRNGLFVDKTGKSLCMVNGYNFRNTFTCINYRYICTDSITSMSYVGDVIAHHDIKTTCPTIRHKYCERFIEKSGRCQYGDDYS